MKTELISELINDSQALSGAKTRFGSAIRTYDDGYGPLWILRDSMEITGIIRARSWEDAYGIAEDEMFPEAEETAEDLIKEYSYRRRLVKIIRSADGAQEKEADISDYPLTEWVFHKWETIETPILETDEDYEYGWMDNALFQEAYGFRNSGPNARDIHGHGIYQKDLNGDYLDRLTPALVAELGITLDLETCED